MSPELTTLFTIIILFISFGLSMTYYLKLIPLTEAKKIRRVDLLIVLGNLIFCFYMTFRFLSKLNGNNNFYMYLLIITYLLLFIINLIGFKHLKKQGTKRK